MTRRPFRVWVLMGLAAAVNRLAGWVEPAWLALDDLTGIIDRWAGTCSECGAWHPSDFDAPEFGLVDLDDVEPDTDCHCGHPDCGAC